MKEILGFVCLRFSADDENYYCLRRRRAFRNRSLTVEERFRMECLHTLQGLNVLKASRANKPFFGKDSVAIAVSLSEHLLYILLDIVLK